jgi:hypothetical protein
MDYFFSDKLSEVAVDSVSELVKTLLDMEDRGDITDDDVDECVYYLQKISEITGLEVDFNIFNDEYVD